MTTLFALGSNGSGQLGLGHDEDTSTRTLVQTFPGKITRLAAGGNHTLILCGEQGRAFASGDDSDGRCGGLNQDANSFGRFREVVSSSGPWTDVAATWSASILSRAEGREVWVCGTGESGELGLGGGVREASCLTKVQSFPPEGRRVVQLAACMAHVVAVLDDGTCWAWGKGRKGQLGGLKEDSWVPKRMEGVKFEIKRAVCGKDFTCLVGGEGSGEVCLLGPEGRDRFGLKAGTPKSVSGSREVHASWGNVFVLHDNGGVIAWGRDDHGQLSPQGLPSVARIAAGSEHCLALTLDGKVVAWGWGEHGNCGEPIDAKGDVRGKWNELPLSGRVEGLFAGCATSFIAVAES